MTYKPRKSPRPRPIKKSQKQRKKSQKPRKKQSRQKSWYNPVKRSQAQKLQLMKARKAKLTKSRGFRLGFGGRKGKKVKANGSLVQYVGSTRMAPTKDRVCNWTHKKLFEEAAKIKKKRKADAKERAKNNWWVQRLKQVHRDAKRNGRPLGWARLTRPGVEYSRGQSQGETALEWGMYGKDGKPSKMKKLKGGGRYMKWE